MGGHAFKHLHCPRIPLEVYAKVKSITTAALRTVFTHVTVPFEVPGKADYGDIDFLVSAPFQDSTELTLSTFPFPAIIDSIKHALNTPHGRRGSLTPDCMYFAISMPFTSATASLLDDGESSDEEQEFWVQVDVKICFKPEVFSWMTFELNFASQSSILGSMIKPLGLTLDPEGLHVRVVEMEGSDWAGSMVLVTRDAWTVCRVLGLGRRVVDGGFGSSEEIYKEYAGGWLFHPGHFKAKLEDESYLAQHSHRSYFTKKWIPERYPEYKLTAEQDDDLQSWTARTRQAVREKLFTMFPHTAADYYTKRAQHIEAVEERRLQDIVTAAIPTGTDGWRHDFELPRIIIDQPTTQEVPKTPQLQPTLVQHGALTPPPSPASKPTDLTATPSAQTTPSPNPPIHLSPLLREPPPHTPRPPPAAMSPTAKLTCLARWTSFTPAGSPYLLTTPHPKDFVLQWRTAIAAGCTEEVLTAWAKEMWWDVWRRQGVVNWWGMWKRRFRKADEKAEREGMDERVDGRVLVEQRREAVLKRLGRLNRVLGLVRVEK